MRRRSACRKIMVDVIISSMCSERCVHVSTVALRPKGGKEIEKQLQ